MTIELRKVSRAIFGAVAIALCVPLYAAPAPGAPGAPAHWAPSQKSFLGTAASSTSLVYFTGHRGILTEVFYPVLDTPNVEDSQFLVGDSAGTWIDEEKLQPYSVTRPDSRALLWRAQTSNNAHHWRIVKRIFTDPARHTLIQRVTFEALNGRHVGQFRVYVLHNPSMDLSGAGDTGRTVVSGTRTYLVASHNSRYGALGVSRPWKVNAGTVMVSNGFVGASDGWTDLLGGSADKTMHWTYDTAGNGNVAQIGWIDFGTSTATSISFDVVLGFGDTEAGALDAAGGTLASNVATKESTYRSEWNTYAAGLNSQAGTADSQYYLAAMTLKASQDKSNGAMIAGIGTPWGETSGDSNIGGYHLVWARDLYKFASALVTAGDHTSANRAVDYLFNIQMDQNTGRFPQNSWINGVPYWNATQMDQQAMPIVLAWKLGRNDLWPKIQRTADYLVANGPWTQQERWEENAGYSPSTMAAEIAGLVCAADIARANGATAKAATYYAVADHWQRHIDTWTFTNSGLHGNGRYYLRINNDLDANDNDTLTLGNGGGAHNEKWIIDGGFLELVRMGVKRPNAPAILDTIPEYDAAIKQTLPGKGDAWFRYNFDGYGEHNDGSNYNGNGRGRLWPIFTAERGMYEISRTQTGASGTTYLNAVRAFSSAEGFIPEQVWNATVNVSGWQVTTPAPYVPGTPTKSISPLNWAMGEYINLMAAIHLGRVSDIPASVCMRYYSCVLPPTAGQASMQLNATATTVPGQSVYVTGNTAALGNWDTGLAVPVNTDVDLYPVWRGALNVPASTSIQYKYFRRNNDSSVTWENLPGGGNRAFTTPGSGASITRNDSVAWP